MESTESKIFGPGRWDQKKMSATLPHPRVSNPITKKSLPPLLAVRLDHRARVRDAPHSHWRPNSSLARPREDGEVQAVFACDARYSS